MLIILQDQDILFARIAQGSIVDGATLPSGLKVPVTPGYRWVIYGETVQCIEEEPTVQLPE